MEHYTYRTTGTCAQIIDFDLDGDKVKNVRFAGGCNGNLKAISKLVDGMPAETIAETLKGNTCGMKPTSCADQLSRALTKALAEAKN